MTSPNIEIRELIPTTLDSKFRGSRVYKKATAGWDRSVVGNGFSVDLSKCVEVDLAGAGQLLTILERACLDGIDVEVVMPAWGVLQHEIDAWERRLEEGVNIERTLRDELASRHNVRISLERYGFEAALMMPHLPLELRRITVRDTRLEVAPFESLSEGLRRQLSALEDLHAKVAEELESNLFIPTELRFRWIDRLTRAELAPLVDELEQVLSQGREALPRADARSVARTIVYEALDNVRVHAYPNGGHGAALIGAAFVLTTSPPQAVAGRQLQIILADSGAGLVNSLRSSFEPSRHDALLPTSVRDWSEDQKTIIWAFHPLSTSRDTDPDEPPVRGLSRARQQVRFHGGSIRVRTADIEVAITDAPTVAQPAYDRAIRTILPGTLLDVRLLTRSPIADRDEDVSGASLRVVPVAVDSTSDRAEELVSVAAVDVANDEVICLVITGLDFSREGGHGAAIAVARLTSLVAGRATICILPDVPSGIIFSVLHSLTEHYEDSERLGEPTGHINALPDEAVMVLGSDRRMTWWGALNGNEAALVDLASRAGFAGEASAFDADDHAATPESLAATRATRAWMVNDKFALSSPHLTESLAEWIKQEVDSAISSGSPGVRTGDEILPSLEAVSQVVEIGPTLAALGHVQLAGQIAGDMARRKLRAQISLIATLPDVPDDFARAFASTIGFDGPRVHLDPSRDGWRLGAAPEHRHGEAILIGGTCRRGESLRNVAEALMRWCIEPQFALIIADSRPEPRLALRAFDTDVPIISLTRIQSPPAMAQFAELLEKQRDTEAMVDKRYPIPPDRLAELLEAHGDGFKLVHVERTEDRHFAGYYDFRSVFADEGLRAEIAHQVTELIQKSSPIDTQHVILYPADDENRAAVLARDVAARLPGATVRPLRRDRSFAVSDDMWMSEKVATFVDWGVVTARTARIALHEMANAGAIHVNFIAVTSQLDPETENHLTALASIYGRSRADPPGELQLSPLHSVPITVAFRTITRIASTAYTRAGCPLCRAVTDFADYAQDCPTEFLRNHAREKIELLRSRPRDEALATNADLYGADLTYAERSNLIKLWSILDRARHSIVARTQLRLLLKGEDDEDAALTAASLCRILAARHDLLQSPPLSDADYRELIVRRSLPLILGGPNVGYIPAPLKRQALVALRASSKERFVGEMASIFESNLRSRTVIAELLLAVYSIIRRPYSQDSALMDSLITSLDAADAIAVSAYESGRTDPDIVHTVRSLRRMATTIRIRQSAPGRQSAWAALRGSYRDDIREHHHAINRMAQVSRQLSDLATVLAMATGDPERLVAELGRMENAWNVCADFLASGVLPYLRDLRDVLSAKYYQEQVGDPAVWEPWRTLLASDVTENDIPFGRLLSQLLLEPAEFNEEARARLKVEISWLQAIFLGIRRRASVQSTSDRRQTFLFRWVGECPTRVSRILEHLEFELTQAHELASRISIVGEPLEATDHTEVFLPDGLMREIAATLVNNVQEHGDLPNTKTSIEIRNDDDTVTVLFLSKGSGRGQLRRPGRPGGLDGLASKIAPFGAELDGRVVGSDFLTSITMRRWDGVAL